MPERVLRNTNPRINYSISARERVKRAAAGLDMGTWTSRRTRRVGTGATLGQPCIRCRTVYPLQSPYVSDYGLCNPCRFELPDHPDPDERERWKRKYFIRH